MSIVNELQTRLGPCVLLPVPFGEKGCKIKGWPSSTLELMADPEHVARLETGATNIGVLLGDASQGLCTIDIDDDEAREVFLEANPALRATLETKGNRGCALWVRINGAFPDSAKMHAGEIDAPTNVGEWRASRFMQVVHGRHPAGVDYHIATDAAPMVIAFESINWPDGWRAPFIVDEAAEFRAAWGTWGTQTQNGSVALNQTYFAARYVTSTHVLYERAEQTFYKYEENSGLWNPVTDDAVLLDLIHLMQTVGNELDLVDQFALKRTTGFLNGVLAQVKSIAERGEVFKSDRGFIHANNCVVTVEEGATSEFAFGPEFYSRNKAPVDYRSGAIAPMFEDQLLGVALGADDISLLQRWCGAALMGGNSAQRILLLLGTAGGGKSTLLNVIERIIGKMNCAELRTEHLADRFEIGSLVGKTMLTGKDVGESFLSSKGAPMLKKLVGHDLLNGERKGKDARLIIEGRFDVAVTCNSRLKVRLEGDVDAWRRRLLVINYTRPAVADRIPNFADRIIDEEGAGVLNWMVAGAELHLMELADKGDFYLSRAQQDRVSSILDESDSVRQFIKYRVTKSSGDVTSSELGSAYVDFCASRGWMPEPARRAGAQFVDLMLEVHRAAQRRDILRDERNQRGWSGVQLLETVEDSKTDLF